jgi:hypothetical protein
MRIGKTINLLGLTGMQALVNGDPLPEKPQKAKELQRSLQEMTVERDEALAIIERERKGRVEADATLEKLLPLLPSIPGSVCPCTEIRPVHLVRSDGGTQARCQMDSATVQRYVEALAAGADFPPLVVLADEEGNAWLADGFHRLEAYRAAQRKEVRVIVHSGTRRDACSTPWWPTTSMGCPGATPTSGELSRHR